MHASGWIKSLDEKVCVDQMTPTTTTKTKEMIHVDSVKLLRAGTKVKFASPTSQLQEVDVSTCTLFFLSLQSQLRMYHWQTKSYARHKATDKLISRLVELSDTFIEVHMGAAGGKRPMAPPLGTVWGLRNIDDDDILEYLDSVNAFLIDRLPTHAHNLPQLLNIRDEMLAAVNQTRYLFTLA